MAKIRTSDKVLKSCLFLKDRSLFMAEIGIYGICKKTFIKYFSSTQNFIYTTIVWSKKNITF